MRQTATYALPSPWRDIGWQLLLWVAFFIVTVLIDFSCTAHAGQQPTTVVGSRPSIRRLRIVNRASVKVARVHGRTIAGFPARQTVKYAVGAVFYGTKAVSDVTGLIPSPGGILANILIRRF
jgi:hypothetical protein